MKYQICESYMYTKEFSYLVLSSGKKKFQRSRANNSRTTKAIRVKIKLSFFLSLHFWPSFTTEDYWQSAVLNLVNT